MMRRRKSGYYRNIGLLVIRVGLGIILILHGYPKVFGGPETWTDVGQSIQYLGIDFAPMFFGFIAGISEFFGGIFMVFGLFFKPSLILLALVMVVATAENISLGEEFLVISHSVELMIVFIGLLFTGPGKYSLDYRINSQYRRF